MKKTIIEIFEKLACKHEWEILRTTEYVDCYKHLLVCKKCGKVRTIRV